MSGLDGGAARAAGELLAEGSRWLAVDVDDGAAAAEPKRLLESLGESRIIAIRTDEVDFLITSFGISRQETLRVKRDKESEG